MGMLYLALVHFPVLNRRGETIASAITSIDLHDLGRLARTYEIPCCYVVTPLLDQQNLAKRLMKHWIEGPATNIHPNRAEALKKLKVVDTIQDAIADITATEGKKPQCWATSARKQNKEKTLTFQQASYIIRASENPILLLLGTAWGLAEEAINACDKIVEPIRANSSFNHLSVRCAAAIIVDRLLGENKTC